jgi:hypothetical protein
MSDGTEVEKTEKECVATGKHEPDWKTVTVEHDGDETYIDCNCKHCGVSGCIGTAKALMQDINWA